ncbi:2-dehydropantoate 2-reductase [Caldimonas brevitalea]|uniref:2-dehydropantoate 2-reductase n=1 Tax=Caldimonas brevitalea TaxID=413882 RepID=A0A0G3BEF2_9BURK|nr:2-dehydropantoate 2-reductase [Caldimonas brevitalea]AKJ27707.1 2-dehydropantoate 2-reductase [Caldimonas brevitalea]
MNGVKVCVYGAGAIGGFIGARLAARGAAVSAIARGANAEALRQHGWRLQTAAGLEQAPVQAVAEDAAQLGPQDLVVVAVKGHALASVARGIAPLLAAHTVVLMAMNGVPWWFFDHFGGPCAGVRLEAVDPGGHIRAALPTEHVIGCVVHATCSMPAPGLVHHGFGQRLIVGEPAGGISARLEALAGLLRNAGFEVEVSSCIQQDIWYKLWGNMTMNPISALTGATCDLILGDALVRRYCLEMMAEARRVGERIGCRIEQSGEDRLAVAGKLGAFKTSMLQDVEAGRPIELDPLLTVVHEIAARLGEPTPQLDALLGLVRLQARVRGLYPPS